MKATLRFCFCLLLGASLLIGGCGGSNEDDSKSLQEETSDVLDKAKEEGSEAMDNALDEADKAVDTAQEKVDDLSD